MESEREREREIEQEVFEGVKELVEVRNSSIYYPRGELGV